MVGCLRPRHTWPAWRTDHRGWQGLGWLPG